MAPREDSASRNGAQGEINPHAHHQHHQHQHSHHPHHQHPHHHQQQQQQQRQQRQGDVVQSQPPFPLPQPSHAEPHQPAMQLHPGHGMPTQHFPFPSDLHAQPAHIPEPLLPQQHPLADPQRPHLQHSTTAQPPPGLPASSSASSPSSAPTALPSARQRSEARQPHRQRQRQRQRERQSSQRSSIGSQHGHPQSQVGTLHDPPTSDDDDDEYHATPARSTNESLRARAEAHMVKHPCMCSDNCYATFDNNGLDIAVSFRSMKQVDRLNTIRAILLVLLTPIDDASDSDPHPKKRPRMSYMLRGEYVCQSTFMGLVQVSRSSLNKQSREVAAMDGFAKYHMNRNKGKKTAS